MSKKTKVRDILIDGQLFKQISIKNKRGESTKFKPAGDGIKAGMHIIESNHDESHFDIYEDGQEVGKSRAYKPRPAGVAIHLSGKEAEFSTLPPVITTDNTWDNLSPIEKVHEYVKRVRFVKKKE